MDILVFSIFAGVVLGGCIWLVIKAWKSTAGRPAARFIYVGGAVVLALVANMAMKEIGASAAKQAVHTSSR